MNFPIAAVFVILLSFGCGGEGITELLSEQQLLKDSANNINDRIGVHLENGDTAKADAQRKQLTAVYTRLTTIQLTIDSLEKIRQ